MPEICEYCKAEFLCSSRPVRLLFGKHICKTCSNKFRRHQLGPDTSKTETEMEYEKFLKGKVQLPLIIKHKNRHGDVAAGPLKPSTKFFKM